MPREVNFIVASEENCEELATLNKKLIDDGGSNNNMSVTELENRMHEFVSGGYTAIIFEADGKHIGYTLIAVDKSPMFVRHFFIDKQFRRKGYGTAAFNKLITFLKVDEIDLSVLASNKIGYEFWRSCGLIPYETFMHFRGKDKRK